MPDHEVLAISAIAHIASDENLLGRFIDLSGLDVPQLRSGLTDAGTQRAALEFLAAHEPDLIRCAEVLLVDPADLIRARDAL
ncbi:DUF3572 family protein [Pacificimonas sp. WHA3]|uniref:DUF3572 family protein n=1 Tax=Pacificimonas pallii TaxID=2827236 RepID=A0ABS6SHB4_9SPHN|nr:DUF3572 family protein [Pacificimonas pallii]MBV7257736.1 DUF3572 family protein [Pacificimonas pallii]